MRVRVRIDRPPAVMGEHFCKGEEEALQADICFSCFTDHDDWRVQDTAACGRCGAPLCPGHLVLGECRYCEHMTDEEVRRKPYTDVE